MTINFSEYLQARRERTEWALDQYLAENNFPKYSNSKLLQAMRYSVFSGGKRLRPILVYASGETFGANLEDLDAPACALEFIHTFSLIQDDLPAMDNDDYRRGKPTCHKVFGEAAAILAGDGLFCLAIEALPNNAMIKELIYATRGIVLGQELDISPPQVSEMGNVAWLEDMYLLKTGALFRASMKLGALAGNNYDNDELKILDDFACALGLAFQIKDDLADYSANKDLEKITYPFLVGIEQSQNRVQELYQQAMFLLDQLTVDVVLLRLLGEMIFTS